MELLRNVVVLLHIVGFAITFGAWVTEAAAKRFRFTRTMDYGLLLSLLTGLALAAPWPAGVELNYPKIGTKLVILVILGGMLGMGSARQRRTGDAVPRLLFWSVGVLSFAAAAIAVLW
ncbi:Fe-S protein [Mycobacterium sp. E740]|uniref:Fe-S protein n=1 Tax=Mycobacterium sp. E740 TaxID=1834149 RepID=UPI00080237E0|nr:Fe-S protein [Mycobacterium sp. E740]OBI82179.1 Fe-S protein [Mycobacterium sp. E740]